MFLEIHSRHVFSQNPFFQIIYDIRVYHERRGSAVDIKKKKKICNNWYLLNNPKNTQELKLGKGIKVNYSL